MLYRIAPGQHEIAKFAISLLVLFAIDLFISIKLGYRFITYVNNDSALIGLPALLSIVIFPFLVLSIPFASGAYYATNSNSTKIWDQMELLCNKHIYFLDKLKNILRETASANLMSIN